MRQQHGEKSQDTLSAYAKHKACSHQAVSKAIKSGRFQRSVVVVDGRPTIPDFAAADAEWEENTRQEDYAGPREREARAELMEAKARMADLVYRQKCGELVNAAAVTAAYADLCTAARTMLMGIPNKVKQRHPDIDRDALVHIEEFIRDALTELARGDEATSGELSSDSSSSDGSPQPAESSEVVDATTAERGATQDANEGDDRSSGCE